MPTESDDHPDDAPNWREAEAFLRDVGDAESTVPRPVTPHDETAPREESSATPRPPPESIGRYQIVREIGRGGMGLVYEAVDSDLDRHIALKVIRSGDAASPEEIRRFRLEAQSAAKLKHPNIVPVYDVGTDGDADYFTMALVDGITLDDWLRGGERSYRDRIAIPKGKHRLITTFMDKNGKVLCGAMYVKITKSP